VPMQIDPDKLFTSYSLTGASFVVNYVSTPQHPPGNPRGAEAPLLHHIRRLQPAARITCTIVVRALQIWRLLPEHTR
jgi:hypothetical protein